LLAADLRRFIHRVPVQAAQRTFAERAADWWNAMARVWRMPKR